MSLGSLVLEAAAGLQNPDFDKNDDPPVDIITFLEVPWGLGIRLFPVQRVILKAHYGLALDDNPFGFDLNEPIPQDHPHYDPKLIDPETGCYKYRIRISDWRRQTFKVFTEAGYLRFLHSEGRCNISEVIPGVERRELMLSVGRRSGKTAISACIAAYETYKLIKKFNPHRYYGILPSNPIQIISVATDKNQAGLLYNDVSGHFKRCSFFSPYAANNTLSFARFQTPQDIEDTCRYSDNPSTAKVSLKVTFTSCNPKGLRGAGNMVIILDELAHFIDNSAHSSADAVYKAVAPSKSAFSPKNEYGSPIGEVESRILAISSPLGRSGFFFEQFQRGMKGEDKNMLCIQAPTWEVNPTIPASEFLPHFLASAANFFTEYGAHFSDRTRGWMESVDPLLACVLPDRRPMMQGAPRRPHYCGLDFGLSNDATGFAIGHLEMVDGTQKIVTDLVDEWRVGLGNFLNHERLDFDEVADMVYNLSRKFYIVDGIFDQWAGVIFEQALHKRGLKQFKKSTFQRAQSSQMYKNFKDVLFEKKIVLYNWPYDATDDVPLCPYLTEIMTLQEKVVSKYISVVEAPQTEGMHDDMSDALIRMVHLATEAMSNGGNITTGTYRTAGVGGGLNLLPQKRHKNVHPIEARRIPRKRRR